jgi:hypothetical protein
MVEKISELSVIDLPQHIRETVIETIKSLSHMDDLVNIFWIQYGLKHVMSGGIVSLKPSYAIRYEEVATYYNPKSTSSGTRYFYQGDDDWNKLDSLYKELIRDLKLNKLGI